MECGNYDVPEALNTSLLLKHLDLLLSGKSVKLPICDRVKSQISTTTELAHPKPFTTLQERLTHVNLGLYVKDKDVTKKN
jgi:uridine kinase